jgi:hypothetical protein
VNPSLSQNAAIACMKLKKLSTSLIRESGTVVSIHDALLTKLLKADVRLRLQGAISAQLATA